MRITIVNRKKYNAGYLQAKVEYDEYDFPIDLDELAEELELSTEPDDFGVVNDEVAVADFSLEYAGLEDLEIDTNCRTLDELAELLDTLNDLNDKLEQLDRYSDIDVFFAAVEAGDENLTLEDLLDFNYDHYYLHSEITDTEDIGRYAYNNDWITEYYDFLSYEAIGHDYEDTIDVREELENRYYPNDIDDPEVLEEILSDYDVEDIDDITVFDITDCSDYDDLGHWFFDHDYISSYQLSDYLDFESIGRSYEDDGTFTSYGWLEHIY